VGEVPALRASVKLCCASRPPACVVLTHWHTQPAVRRAEPSMPLLLILALCQ
jgi:hypothetical protein